ncbi:unnamed protein product [Jaminaea pallidilutea]
MSKVAQESAAAKGGGGGVGPSRRTWDVQEYAQKARQRDREEKERAQDNEERMRKGQRPLPAGGRRQEILPDPTTTLQARAQPLDFDKNVGKTLMVENSAERRGGPGYYCELCRRTCKDSMGYLDHINGKTHLLRLGQSTQVARSTVEEVRAKLAELRSRVKEKDAQREYDFESRVAEIAKAEKAAKEEKKRKRAQEKEERKKKENSGGAGAQDEEMMKMMGFGGFGGSRK